ncbi:MAG: hypothetical protein VKK59_02280 [Vampirovibrionales bacterium]|nr:hypothetical protein [Vampirovibrionales bacterium]
MLTSLDTIEAYKAHLNRIDDFMEHIRLAKSITSDTAMHAVLDHLLDEEAEHREVISEALSSAKPEHRQAISEASSIDEISAAEGDRPGLLNFQTPELPARTLLTVGSLYGKSQ